MVRTTRFALAMLTLVSTTAFAQASMRMAPTPGAQGGAGVSQNPPLQPNRNGAVAPIQNQVMSPSNPPAPNGRQGMATRSEMPPTGARPEARPERRMDRREARREERRAERREHRRESRRAERREERRRDMREDRRERREERRERRDRR